MKYKKSHKSAGFTLMELMISMGVTLTLLYAAVSMFKNASQANQAVSQSTDMNENLRSGLNLLEQDLQQAGEGIPTGGIPSRTRPMGTPRPPAERLPSPIARR